MVICSPCKQTIALIKNSRANDSRHNYDFKYPHSNGNVIYNCIGENSKYSSDFHMYLSMANLIDNFTVDKDYLESSFRPYGGNVIHGYSSTQSVFYNTKGNAYHPNRDYIIESRQYKHGYIIGTSGAANKVKIDPLKGTAGGYAYDTAPRDFSEGIGKGDELYPKSLYLDQFERRLKDSTGLSNLKATIKVFDLNTGNPLPDCKVSNFGVQQITNNSGETSFEKLSNILSIQIEKEFFETISTEQFPIFSDTTLSFYMAPDKYKITIVVSDIQTGELFSGTRVTFNDELQITNELGEVYFEAYPGTFSFLIEKNSYKNESGQIAVDSDITKQILMIRNEGLVKFKLYEGTSTPVNKATVILNNDTLITTSLGISNFRNLAVNEQYNYLIFKGGYNDLSGSLILENDTTITLEMIPYLTSATNKSESGNIQIWPNPVSETLNLQMPPGFNANSIEIFDINGISVKKFIISQQQQFALEVHDLPQGIYLLKIVSSQNYINQLFIKT